MIKQIYMCECDICGAVEKAKLLSSNTNDENYGLPYDWCHGKNHDICICPECSAKLNSSKTTPTPTYIANAEAVPVYGCPAVTYTSLTSEPSITLNLTKGSAVLDSEN